MVTSTGSPEPARVGLSVVLIGWGPAGWPGPPLTADGPGVLETPLRWWAPPGAAEAGCDGWFGPLADGGLVRTGGSVVTETSLLEPRCGGSADRLALLGSELLAVDWGVEGWAVGAATGLWTGPPVRGPALGILLSTGWLASVDRPCWGLRLTGVWLWWLPEPGWSNRPVGLVELGRRVAGDGLVGWLAAAAWPGMAA